MQLLKIVQQCISVTRCAKKEFQASQRQSDGLSFQLSLKIIWHPGFYRQSVLCFQVQLTKVASLVFFRLLMGIPNKPATEGRSVLGGKYSPRKLSMQLGQSTLSALYVRRRTIKSNLSVTRSPYRAAKTGLMCSTLLVLVNS